MTSEASDEAPPSSNQPASDAEAFRALFAAVLARLTDAMNAKDASAAQVAQAIRFLSDNGVSLHTLRKRESVQKALADIAARVPEFND